MARLGVAAAVLLLAFSTASMLLVSVWTPTRLHAVNGASPPQPPPPSPSPSPLAPSQFVKSVTGNSTSLTSSSSSCAFKGCPADALKLFAFTPHRNRVASYSRLVRTLHLDAVTDAPDALPGPCICLVVSDFDDVVTGPPLALAMDSWPWGSHIVPISGSFSPAFGFEAAVREVVATSHVPSSQRLIVRIDADMVTFPGFLRQLVTHTVYGYRAFAPVCWSTSGLHDPTDGLWRVTGTGALSVFYDDMQRVVGSHMPLAGKSSYGSEDHLLFLALDMGSPVGFNVTRRCVPQLWHLAHPKHKWTDSVDGLRYKKRAAPAWDAANRSSWEVAVPPVEWRDRIIHRGEMAQFRCIALECGMQYPRKEVFDEWESECSPQWLAAHEKELLEKS